MSEEPNNSTPKKVSIFEEITVKKLLYDKEYKKAALIAVYPQLMNELTFYRSLIERIVLGYLGILLLLLGWIFSGEKPKFNLLDNVFILVMIISFFGLILMGFLHKYLTDVSKAVSNIERVFLMQEDNAYLKGKRIFPKYWEKFGTYWWFEPMVYFGYSVFLFTFLLSYGLYYWQPQVINFFKIVFPKI